MRRGKTRKDGATRGTTSSGMPRRLALESLENGTPVILTEAVGFYEYVRDVEQDFVKRIDLEEPNEEMREFLFNCSARNGLDRIETIFDAKKIRHSLLRVMIPDGHQTVKTQSNSTPKPQPSAAVSEV